MVSIGLVKTGIDIGIHQKILDIPVGRSLVEKTPPQLQGADIPRSPINSREKEALSFIAATVCAVNPGYIFH